MVYMCTAAFVKFFIVDLNLAHTMCKSHKEIVVDHRYLVQEQEAQRALTPCLVTCHIGQS